jgi:K+-transporting ATPase c subunit
MGDGSEAHAAALKTEIEQVLQKHAAAPLGGLAGEKLVNVLVVNLELRNRLICQEN